MFSFDDVSLDLNVLTLRTELIQTINCYLDVEGFPSCAGDSLLIYISVTQGAALVALTPSVTVVRVTMDFFQHRYYRLNKILMTLIGQWPYQRMGARRGIALAAFTSIQLTPLFMALMKYRDDGSVLLDGVLALIFGAVSATKGFGFMLNSQKTLKLLNRIRTDWHEWARDREVNILHQYAEQGRKRNIAYIVMNITNNTVFMIQPMVPKIIDIFLKNGTEPGAFPYPVDFYHLDVQKYYFYIIVYSYVCASTISIFAATSGVMFICYVQHVCGLFAALGHKLDRLGYNITSVKTGETRYALDKKDIVMITSCIDRHNDAIEYVNLIATSYSWIFFFTIGFGMIMFNIAALQVLMRTNDLGSTIRFIFCVLTVMLYFYVDCYISETVTDHSISIYLCIHNSQWYKLSLKAQKLLQFMSMRCSVPCHLTAGKMLVMSMRSYWLTAKTAMSYLMVLRSMQGL